LGGVAPFHWPRDVFDEVPKIIIQEDAHLLGLKSFDVAIEQLEALNSRLFVQALDALRILCPLWAVEQVFKKKLMKQ
jgi:hypothetical protein